MKDHFRFKPGIPYDFALSVMFIIAGKNKQKSWRNVKKRFLAGEPVFDWIKSILDDNKFDSKENKIGWWKAKLEGN